MGNFLLGIDVRLDGLLTVRTTNLKLWHRTSPLKLGKWYFDYSEFRRHGAEFDVGIVIAGIAKCDASLLRKDEPALPWRSTWTLAQYQYRKSQGFAASKPSDGSENG